MANRNPDLFGKGFYHLRNPFNLRGNGDIPHRTARRSLVFAEEANVPLLEQVLRHCALVLRCQERAFQMRAEQLRPFRRASGCLPDLLETPGGLFLGIGQDAGEPACCPLRSEKLPDLFQPCHIRSIDIHTSSAVGMHIEKAGHQIGAIKIDHFAVCRNPDAQRFDLPILYQQIPF